MISCKSVTLAGTKERAIIHALASASVVDVVAQSCYAGNLTSCGMCPVNMLNIGANPNYQWGLCSDNIIVSSGPNMRPWGTRFHYVALLFYKLPSVSRVNL